MIPEGEVVSPIAGIFFTCAVIGCVHKKMNMEMVFIRMDRGHDLVFFFIVFQRLPGNAFCLGNGDIFFG